MRELKSGTQLASRYTLTRKLGEGGGKQTWIANDKLTRASVALKINVDPGRSNTLLRREWQLSIRLVHAHIVRVFEFHDDADGAFYSLQFIDGPDCGVLSGAALEEVLAPIALVADALRYAHGKGVVHRDIKASNILLDANGAPYLIDFGVASHATDHVGGGSLIAASPQHLDGAAAQPADDIFALGGLIYELISGRSPYSSASTAADIRNAVPPPLTAAAGGEVPSQIQALVRSMLDKEADRRPDASALVDAIANAGIKAGPAPARLVAKRSAVGDEVIDAGRIRPGRKTPSAVAVPEIAAERIGIQPRTVGIGLGVLVLLLLGVVFLLPKTVERDDAAVTDTAADEGAAKEMPTEDVAATPERDVRVQQRAAAEEVLGRLLAKMQTLEGRAVQRWGGLPWKRAEEEYAAGDAAYLDREYELAKQAYARAAEQVEPLLEQVDAVFQATLADAERALENGDTVEALRLYELAVAITPGHAPARAGLLRAQNLDRVLVLTEQGLALERDLELDAARRSFEEAIELDPQWTVARHGLDRVSVAIKQAQFDARMTEGLSALAERDYPAARAAFTRARQLEPGSPEPADGLLQVDQGIRLDRIASLEQQAAELENDEQWQAAAEAYQNVLDLDANLTFAQTGLLRANGMIALYKQLDNFIADPDSLSLPRNMQAATKLVVDITRMPTIGLELESRRDALSKLLKRAATPLTVKLVSDNLTDVAIYKIGKLGTFVSTELSLRPGTYIAIGSRPGYRDVRLEFRVAPEIDMQPVVVRCEEQI